MTTSSHRLSFSLFINPPKVDMSLRYIKKIQFLPHRLSSGYLSLFYNLNQSKLLRSVNIMHGEKGNRVEENPLFWNYCKYIHRLQLLPFSSEQFYLPASYKSI